MDSDREYLSKRHSAAYLDLSVGKIEAEIRAGRLRAFNIGHKILVRRADLEAWISAREVTRPENHTQKSELRLLVDRAVERARSGGTAIPKPEKTASGSVDPTAKLLLMPDDIDRLAAGDKGA